MAPGDLADRAASKAGLSPASDEKAAVRATLFNHLAGIVVIPTLKALLDRRVFDLFGAAPEPLELDRIARRTHGNRGYLRVAFRLLASCGWLEEHSGRNGSNVVYALTDKGRFAIGVAAAHCNEVISFLPKAIFLEDFLFGRSDEAILPSLRALVQKAAAHWGLAARGETAEAELCRQVGQYLDGLLVGPAMVSLARGGILERLAQGPVQLDALPGNHTSLGLVFDLLAAQGWIARERDLISLTPSGSYAAQIATSYGVTVSYLPTFQVVDTLLFGNPRIPRVDETGSELLVNRGMNVWGSGGAHNTYFKKVDEIVIEIFNRPLEQQPEGICDMGCGDGTLLEHLYCVIKSRTLRGSQLDKHPLLVVGVDFNKVARRITKQRLRKAEIPLHYVISGDVNRPALLGSDLEGLGHDVHNLLHVRSFLDHNRPYLQPANYIRGTRTGQSTGAFAHLGEEIPCDELEENLVRHLRRWAPYVGRFGLLVLELHTLPPQLTAANLSKTPAVAYDGTHGFSDQYLVELPVFLDCAREAGLHSDPRYQCKFPPSGLATVSINFFTAAVPAS
ncbi:MAG TPA: class I SAM-dependent methyltransferase [Verrucomicrobiae bacterium]|nr:class I SAM-dependent methyltransferase [Verrucomicrobiae bacterium]